MGKWPLRVICASCTPLAASWGRYVRERAVLLAVHDHAGERQGEELRHQVGVVREVDHGFKDAPDRCSPGLVPHAVGVERTRIVRCRPVAGDEVLEEQFRVLVGMEEDLPVEEAVLQWNVSFDVRRGRRRS